MHIGAVNIAAGSAVCGLRPGTVVPDHTEISDTGNIPGRIFCAAGILGRMPAL